MPTSWSDLRYSLRLLAAHRSVTLVALVTLGLGIGATTAVFSILDTVLLKPLPYPTADRLVVVGEQRPGFRGRAALTNELFFAWRESTTTLDGLAGYGLRAFTLTGPTEPDRVRGAVATPALFSMLRAIPLKGRLFEPGEDRPGAHRVVLLSERAWRTRFAADAGVIGRPIVLDGEPYTVVGVLPSSFYFFPDPDVELWAPFVVDAPSSDPRERRIIGFPGVALVKPGVPLAQVAAEGTTVAQRLPRPAPRPGEPPVPVRVRVARVADELVADVKPALAVLAAAVGLVLLIACVNVANLLLARATARQREIAVRAALGATRARLVRQLLTESLVLGVLGGAAGLLLAAWLVRALPAIAPATLPMLARGIPRLHEVAVDARVLAFAGALAVGTALLFGLAPAWHATRLDLARAINEGGIQSAGGFRLWRGSRLRGVLVIAEVALALVLLVGAGLLGRSFLRLVRVDTGYDPSNVLTAQITLPPVKYRDEAALAFLDALLDRVSGLSGVRAVGITNLLPLTPADIVISFDVVGRVRGSDEEGPSARVRIVSPGFFRALGLTLTDGRLLTDADRAGTTPVVIVNEALAAKYFDGRATGARLTGLFGPGTWDVVGVVRNVRGEALDAQFQPELYVSYRQLPARAARMVAGGLGTWIVARTSGDPLALVGPLRREVRALDPDLPLDGVMTMEARVAAVARPRFYAVLVGAFAAVALGLAAVGLYGLLSHTVAMRSREIGVRLALGAQPRAVVRLVVGQALGLVGLGVAVGVAAAFAVTRLLRSLLFGVTATDPLTFTVVPLLLVGVALAACYGPARRATRVDPIEALRYP
jgi:putative ABC transport system permease protein